MKKAAWNPVLVHPKCAVHLLHIVYLISCTHWNTRIMESRPHNTDVSQLIFPPPRLPIFIIFIATIFILRMVQISKQLTDWTSILKSFHRLLKNQRTMRKSPATFDTLVSRQLYALYDLHTSMVTSKPLFNLQLAATHVAFMLDHDTQEKVGNSFFVYQCLL